MELYLEIIINFFVILFICCFASLVFCAKDKLSSDGIYIVSDKVKEKHYHLKFSKVFFLVVFAINRKWNKGLISKYTFWALSILYYYFIAEFICHIIFCIVANKSLVIDFPLIYIILVLIIPAVYIIIAMNVIAGFTKRNTQQ